MEAIKKLFNFLLGKPPVLVEAEAVVDRANQIMDEYEAALNGEEEWFLKCTKEHGTIQCAGEVKPNDS